MAEIFRAFGMVFIIFSDDHDPPHVHVFHGNETCKIMLRDLTVAIKPRCSMAKNNLRRALHLAAEHRALLLREWEKIHG